MYLYKKFEKSYFLQRYTKTHTSGARNGGNMGKVEIVGYELLVNNLKELILIQKKQYNILQTINAETINFYWEIGEEIYRQQEQNGQGISIV